MNDLVTGGCTVSLIHRWLARASSVTCSARSSVKRFVVLGCSDERLTLNGCHSMSCIAKAVGEHLCVMVREIGIDHKCLDHQP